MKESSIIKWVTILFSLLFIVALILVIRKSSSKNNSKGTKCSENSLSSSGCWPDEHCENGHCVHFQEAKVGLM